MGHFERLVDIWGDVCVLSLSLPPSLCVCVGVGMWVCCIENSHDPL